jgi:uncharacterized protein YggU (UPF0235/DUF167 family)
VVSPQRAPATVAVRVKPGSSRVKVGGRYEGPYGPAIIVAVPAPAVEGRATEAARRALAEALRVRPGHLDLRTGAASRDKLFTVTDPPADLDERVRALRDG